MTWYYITFTLQCMTYSWHCIALHFKHWKTLHNRTKHIITEHCITLPYLTLQHSTLLSVTLQAYMHTCIHAYMHTYRQTDRPTDRHTYTLTHIQRYNSKQNRTKHYITFRYVALHYITWHNFNYITLPSFTSHHINYITLPCLTLHSNYITDTSQRKRLQDVSRYPQAKGNDYLYRNHQKPNSSHQIYVQSWMRLSNCLFNICGSTVSHRFWFVLFVGVAVNISSPERTGQYVHLLLDVMETLGT